MRWSFIAGGPSAPRQYRADLMAEGLNAIGEEAVVWHGSLEGPDHTIRGCDPATGRWDQTPADVVVCRFYMPPPADALMIRARTAGQIVLWELDDDMWAVKDWNPPGFAKVNLPAHEEMLVAMQMNMVCADAIVAATPTLAERVVNITASLGEEAVPVAWVRSPVHLSDPAPGVGCPPRVGWLGPWSYRGRDLQMIAPALATSLSGQRGILRRIGRLEDEPPLPVMLLAADPDGHEPPYVIHEHGWVDLADLPPLLNKLDLAVIPAEPCTFSASRSATTGLAFAAAAVPFISSPTPEYEWLADNGVGLLADGTDTWATLIGDLIDDRRLRRELGDRARQIVGDLCSPERAALQWITIVEAL